jgi:hypothetical protein
VCRRSGARCIVAPSPQPHWPLTQFRCQPALLCDRTAVTSAVYTFENREVALVTAKDVRIRTEASKIDLHAAAIDAAGRSL